MKRVLQIPNFYPPNKGGIEIICKYVIESLSSFEHQVICFSASKSTYTDEVEGVKVTRIGSFCKIASQNISIKYLCKLREKINDYKPDLIHFHAPNPLVMVYLLILIPKTCRLIVHWHSDIVEQKFLYLFVKPFEKMMLKRADIILGTSPNYINGSKPLQLYMDKVRVLPLAINALNFDIYPEEQAKYLELRDKYKGKKIVFFVGRHVTYKGLKFLLNAEKFIKNDCLFLIAGSGPLTETLKNEYVSQRIEFLGRLSDLDLKFYMHLSDIFAFPSITKNEAFGLVLAEVMYCETPVVTFTINGSGVNWVSLNGITGIEVENSNAVLFAEAIDKLLKNDELRASYAHNAKLRVLDNFVMGKFKPQLEAIYSELI